MQINSQTGTMVGSRGPRQNGPPCGVHGQIPAQRNCKTNRSGGASQKNMRQLTGSSREGTADSSAAIQTRGSGTRGQQHRQKGRRTEKRRLPIGVCYFTLKNGKLHYSYTATAQGPPPDGRWFHWFGCMYTSNPTNTKNQNKKLYLLVSFGLPIHRFLRMAEWSSLHWFILRCTYTPKNTAKDVTSLNDRWHDQCFF